MRHHYTTRIQIGRNVGLSALFLAALIMASALLDGCASEPAPRLYGASAVPVDACFTGASCDNEKGLECCAVLDCLGCLNTRCRAPGGDWRLLWRDCSELDGSQMGICRPKP